MIKKKKKFLNFLLLSFFFQFLFLFFLKAFAIMGNSSPSRSVTAKPSSPQFSEEYSFSAPSSSTSSHLHIITKSTCFSSLNHGEIDEIIKTSKLSMENSKKSLFNKFSLNNLNFFKTPQKNSPSSQTRKSTFEIRKNLKNNNFVDKKEILRSIVTNFKSETNSNNKNMFSKRVSYADEILSCKSGKKIFFRHIDDNHLKNQSFTKIPQKNESDLKNPFEDIRMEEEANNRQSTFKDDMAIVETGGILPEEKNSPSHYYEEVHEKSEKKLKQFEKEDNHNYLEEKNGQASHLNYEKEKYIKITENLINKIVEANTTNLEGFEKIYEDFENDYRLQIFMKTYVSPDKHRINIFRTQFTVPCEPKFFLDFMNNIPEQSKIDKQMDQFYCIEEISMNLWLIYLSYKKLLISSPRELIYLKRMQNVDEDKNIWCDVSQSIEYKKIPVRKEKIRAEIILSGHYVQPDEWNLKNSIVRLYSEVDFKTNVPVFMAKSFSVNEMKKYTGECVRRIKEMRGL